MEVGGMFPARLFGKLTCKEESQTLPPQQRLHQSENLLLLGGCRRTAPKQPRHYTLFKMSGRLGRV